MNLEGAQSAQLPVTNEILESLRAIKTSVMRSESIELSSFLGDMFWTVLLSFLLGALYVRFGRSLSNRRQFAAHFVLIAMATMLVITLVKASLALSLGLVGALSIVRFRTAIKEPEELAYLFVAIAIGLGYGANQGQITIAATATIAVVIVIRSFFLRDGDNRNLNLLISAPKGLGVTLEQIEGVLKNHCRSLRLRRFDQSNGDFEASFLVEFDRIENFKKNRAELLDLNKELSISYVDSRDFS